MIKMYFTHILRISNSIVFCSWQRGLDLTEMFRLGWGLIFGIFLWIIGIQTGDRIKRVAEKASVLANSAKN